MGTPQTGWTRGTMIGLLLVVVLAAVAVYSAAHGLLLGVLLAGFASLLFLVAVIDNRYYLRRRTPGDGEPGGDGEATPPGP
jgi:hypothetical protein